MEQRVPDMPLSGLRVLDLSRVLAGPYMGRMLADLGAEVVKVEPPEGDVTRHWGKDVAGLSGYYTQQNVGKRSVCVDLRVAGGPELVRGLALCADVVLENFRPGVMDQYHLGYAELSACAPRLIMVSISGFGQDGPEARRPAYASVVHAESGVVRRLRPTEDGPLFDPRLSIADMSSGLHGLVALLSAVIMRERTGVGQHIDIAMLDAMLATDDYIHEALDGVPEPHGISNEIWDTVAGPIVIAGPFRWIWKRIHQAHGVQDPTPKGAELAEKIACRRHAIGGFFASHQSPEALFAALDEAGLAYGLVKRTAEAVVSSTVQHRRSIVMVDDRVGGKRSVVQSPYRFSNAHSGARPEGAAYRGEHNSAVLRDWLTYDEGAIAALTARGVLRAAVPG